MLDGGSSDACGMHWENYLVVWRTGWELGLELGWMV